MSLFTCEHPQKVINPYSGETLFVPCGKCYLCRAKKASEWTERLEVERASHPYTLFGTLTYSDDYLPHFDYDGNGLVDVSTGELVPYDELKDFLDYDSINFINKRGCLPCGSVLDCQRFIKRLRETIRRGSLSDLPDSTDRQTDRYLRYFLVLEYGETTFRPHYHFLVFTSSKWFATYAKDVVAACWKTDSRRSDSEQLGIIDCQNVQSSASAYVAQYLNSFTNCPSIYRHRRFKPFKLFSKHPPLGSLVTKSKEVQELFHRESVKINMFRRSSNEFVEFPLPKSLYSRLYPKVVGFSRFPSYVLSGLYNSSYYVKGFSYKEFGEYVRKRAFTVFDGLSQYYVWLLNNTSESESNLHQVFSCLRRVGFQSEIFGVSCNTYYEKICRFYSNQDYDRLYSQFNDIESNEVSPSYQLLTDLVFIDRVSHCELDSITNHDLLILKSYGWDDTKMSLTDFLESLDFTSDLDYIQNLSKAKKIIEDTRKKKAKNEYLQYRTKDKEFINFLIDYHGLSKHYEGVVEPLPLSK